MIDLIKACIWSLLILIVLLLDILSDRANHILWSGSVGWLIGQAMSRLLWYSGCHPWWKRWVYTLDYGPVLVSRKEGKAIDRHLWLE